MQNASKLFLNKHDLLRLVIFGINV